MQDQTSTSQRSYVGPIHALRSNLRTASGLMLLLISGVVAVHAQTVPMRDVIVGQKDATPASVPQTRARRVGPSTSVKSDAPLKKSSAVAEEKSPNALKAKAVPLVKVDLEEPPPPMKEARNTDRVTALQEQIKAAKDDNERARLQHTLVDYLVAMDRKHEALNELRSMMRDERFDPVGFYNIGNALARLGDTDTAIDAYRKAVQQRHGNYSRALNNLGVMLLRQERFGEAYESFLSALKQENFRYAEASYNLGRVYAAQGATEMAIREWKRTLSLQPAHAEATLALARAYLDAGNPTSGLILLDGFTARQGASTDAAARMAELRKKLVASTTPKPATRP